MRVISYLKIVELHYLLIKENTESIKGNYMYYLEENMQHIHLVCGG